MTACKLSSEDRNIIAKGEWLTGDHIDTFGRLLGEHSDSEFVMQETWKIQLPHNITAERADHKFIQILHSSEGINNTGGHWVCAYYDTRSLFILDSLNLKKLHPHHKLYLQRLFPTYPFDKRPVKFPVVTNQPNSSDCGVYAIAFAISLFFGIKPEAIQYDVKSMRQHLLEIFDTGIISHFPHIVKKGDSIKIPSLQQLKRRRENASRKRFRRQSNQRDQDVIPAKSHNCENRNVMIREKTVAGENHLARKLDLFQVENNCTLSTARNIHEKIVSLNHSSLVFGIPQRKVQANSINLKLPIVAQIQERCSGEDKLLPPKVVTFAEASDIIPYDVMKQEKFIIDLENKENQEFFYETRGKNHSVIAVRKNKDPPLTNDSGNRKKHKNSNSIDAGVQNCQKLSTYCIKRHTLSEFNQTMVNPTIDNGGKKYTNIIPFPIKKTIMKNSDLLAQRGKRKISISNDAALENCPKRLKLIAPTPVHSYVNDKKDTEKSRQLGHIKLKIQKAKSLSRKYSRIRGNNDSVKIANTKGEYVKRLTKKLRPHSVGECLFEAERIIKWCFRLRGKKIFALRQALLKIKHKAQICLTLKAAASDSDKNNRIIALCGSSRKHTALSEPYYGETAYIYPRTVAEPIVMNVEAKATNVLPLIVTKKMRSRYRTWDCSEHCRIPDNVVLDKFEKFMIIMRDVSMRKLKTILPKIRKCTVKHTESRLGHSQACYMQPLLCESLLLSLEFLSPHFPQVRLLKRLFYSISALLQNVMEIDNALDMMNVEKLLEFANKAKENATHFQSTDEILLDEDAILRKYAHAFQAFQKKASNLPRFPCRSCQKLCCLTDVRKLDNIRVLPTGKIWDDLQLFIENNKDCDSDYICQYCLTKFRSGNIPPTCVLNNLHVCAAPTSVQNLNEYEKILIQRAKTFQTVVKMGTVHKKNMPHRKMYSKAQGRAFHLPLPLEKTLEKICPSTSPINLDHELYILVRGVPTKSKKVWESIVDIKKVYDALLWLKDNNPNYSNIKLPERWSDLLDTNLREVVFQISQDCPSDDDIDDPDIVLDNRKKEDQQGNDVVLEKREKKIQKVVSSKQIEGRAGALLTQMTPSDSFYEQYTILRMHAPKENKTASELYQMLKVHDEPLDNRYKLLDLLCFPDVYPNGINGEHQERPVHISAFEYAKLRILSRNSQFRLNQQYLFFLLNAHNIRQLQSGIYHKLNVTDGRMRYTSASYLAHLLKGELEGNLSTIFSKLRNTEQYWHIPRSNLNCMIREYGPPTWFLTISPSEWQWDRLSEFLREMNPSLGNNKSLSELIAADPISASIFINNEFRAMIEFLRSNDNPIGKVIRYVIRREYQGRGIQHFHLLIWVEDAPILGKSSKEEVADFIKTYVTCRIPNPKVSPQLYRRVTTHQSHHHNSYCMRSKSVGTKGKGGSCKVCRFSFPRPVSNEWVIRDVQTSIAGRRNLKSKCQLYDNPRSLDEVNINNYNPAVLTAWEGNMDISFIGEISAALAWYLTKYISKSEKTHVGETFDQVNSTKSVASRLWNIGLRGLNSRECGALEAADTLLGYPLFETDPETTIRWVDINIVRTRRVKPRKEVEAMDAESTDIFYNGLMENYPKRPAELDGLCLYDYAKWYDIVKTMPQRKAVVFYKLKPGSYLRKRDRGYLINHYQYDPVTSPEKYFYSLLVLFQPWRTLTELKNGEETYTASYCLVQDTLPMAAEYHERSSEIMKNMKEVKELIQQKMDEMKKDEENQSDLDNVPIGCDPIEAGQAMKDFVNLGANEAHKELNMSEMIHELNTDQKRIFDLVTETMNSNEILRLYVSGEGGTGKSFLIKTITCWLKQVKGKDSAVTAPTGIAAFNIDGFTVHRLFQLPVEHNQTPKYRELSDAALEVIRDTLKNVDLIIIDEISMVSNITLMYIHLRLTEIFNSADVEDGWFGKKHIIVFGDLLQLPPVREEPVFMKLSSEKVVKLIGSLGTTDLWSNLFKYDELSINMRQKNDLSYREMLSKIRFGCIDSENVQMLESRKIVLESSNICDRIRELCNYINSLPSDAVCLMPVNRMCDVLNEAMLDLIPTKAIELIAEDIIDKPSLKTRIAKILQRWEDDASQTAGLARLITVKIGAKIMLRRNIDVTVGLVNGTIGTIVAISESLDKSMIEKVTIVLTNGAQYDIERVSVKFQVIDGVYVLRRQFPLCLSYGITIHKSQGLSLKHAVIECGNSVFSCGQIYVALSRVTSLDGLHLINFDPYSIRANPLCITEYNRLRKLYRPDLENIKIPETRGSKTHDVIWAVSKGLTEVQIQDNKTCNRQTDTITGFLNNDLTSCYANTVIQCIFNCEPIVRLLQEANDCQTLVASLQIYKTKASSPSELSAVRKYIGETFVKPILQDASQFFNAICQAVPSIKTLVEFQFSTKTRCKACGYTNSLTDERRNVLIMDVLESNKTLTLQEVIDGNLAQWKTTDSPCNNCPAMKRDVRFSLTTVQKVLVILLALSSVDSKTGKPSKKRCKIKAVPSSKLILCGQTYKVISAIFHHGENINTGHYTCMIRQGRSTCMSVDDTIIEKKTWPVNANNAYMFFLAQ